MNSKKIKLGILALSFPQMAALAITPCLSGMAAYFPDAPTLYVQLISSTPALIGCITGILAGGVSSKIPMKYTSCIGLALMVISGIWGFTAQDMRTLVFASVVMGLGLGTLSTSATSLINYYFEGDEQATLMGWTTTTKAFGGILMSLLGGYLAAIDWRYNYLCFLLITVPLIVAVITLPADKIEAKKGQDDTENSKKSSFHLSSAAAAYIILLIPGMICFNSFGANISMYLKEVGLGESIAASYAITLFLLAGVAGGMVLGKYCAFLKKYALCISMLTGGIGLFCIIILKNTPAAMIGSFIVGLGMNFFIPICFMGVARSSDTHSAPLAIAFSSASCNIGQFLSSIALTSCAASIGTQTAGMRYQIAAIGLLVMGILVLIFLAARRKTKTS